MDRNDVCARSDFALLQKIVRVITIWALIVFCFCFLAGGMSIMMQSLSESVEFYGNYAWLGALICAIILASASIFERYTSSASSSLWTKYYGGSLWRTMAGETVTIVAMSSDGLGASVRFDDGYCGEYPLWLMEPLGDFERVQRPDLVSGNDDFLSEVAFLNFKMCDGWEGCVRGASKYMGMNGIEEKELVLKTCSGGVKRIDFHELTACKQTLSL